MFRVNSCHAQLDPMLRPWIIDGRVITQRWSGDYNSLCQSLNLKLTTRRRIQKLKLCYKIVNNLSSIPASTFIPRPSPQLHHSKPIRMPFVSTIVHK